MTSDSTANAYLRTKVLTATPEELRLMLIEGAIKFLTQAKEGLLNKDYELSFNGFSKCRNIILELVNSMRPDVDSSLCRRVGTLYTFMYSQTVEASLDRDITKVDNVLGLLEYERETWLMLMAKLAEERRRTGASPVPISTVAPAAVRPAGAGGEHRPLSIQA
jgi:flagellar secretion chaperone FliS